MEHLVRVLFIILISVGTGYHSQAQGIHFSQAYSAHLTLNPANTGRHNGDWRAVGIFRQQGHHMGNDYQTAYFSFENPYYVKEEKLDVGLYYSRDNSAGHTFPVDRINLSAGHGIRLNHMSYLHAGVQLAWVHKQINMNGLSFPDQYNRETGGFDPTQLRPNNWKTIALPSPMPASVWYMPAAFRQAFSALAIRCSKSIVPKSPFLA
ncbi:type IX secretion system membrane protein PorP/SprF [Geofilum rubicundum]|uniref:Type IX secretion system membrane protein PorP/SprF n=1 Tax=Geofilum rubicundum JCM 15548 TaxID=1236989 RepID=A0A0E9LUJ0_9BACT|nr:type IX secretion system membrane protein PorP/SprF [Geofilum rubicundum]GAO28904.1 hypothetical protein JCM15548_11043 [Geofilum rubicundum JCM 15548]